ncbi:MaoC family dehydratase [Profundibacter sp.]
MPRSEASPPSKKSNKSLESLKPGDRITLPDIDCREAAIATYVELFDARHPIHTDEEYARKTSFGQRIVHGPFPVAAVLASLGEVFGETLIALTEIGDWRFLRPVPVGAKVPAEMGILTIDRTSGRIRIEVRIYDEAGHIAQAGEVGLLLRRARPKAGNK